MTLVNIDLRVTSPSGVEPAVGYVSVCLFRRQHVDTPEGEAGDFIHLPNSAHVELVGGMAAVELAPTGVGEAWVVSEHVPGGSTRYVAVPDVASVDYGDLVDLDPSTLAPVDGGGASAWELVEAQLAALTTRVEELETVGKAGYASLDERVGALEAAAGGGGEPTVTVSGRWQLNPQGGSPQGGQVTSAEGDFTGASELRFRAIDLDGTNKSTVLQLATELYGQDRDNPANWVRYRATGEAVYQSPQVNVPVVQVAGGGSQAGVNWQDSVWVFVVPYEALMVAEEGGV